MSTTDPRAMLFTVLGVVPVLIWSAAVAVAASLTAAVGPATSAGAVYACAAVFAFAALGNVRRIRVLLAGVDLRAAAITFVFFIGNLLGFWFGIGLVDRVERVPELGVVNYLWPTMTVVFSILLLRRRVRWWIWPAILISAVGALVPVLDVRGISVADLVSHFGENPASYLLVLLCAVMWGIYSNLTKKWSSGMNAAVVAAYLLLSGLVFLTIAEANAEMSTWGRRQIIEVVALGAGDAMAYVLWDLAMRRGHQLVVAWFSYLTPLLSTLFTVFYLGIPVGAWLWIGCGLVLAGGVLGRMALRVDGEGSCAGTSLP